MRICSDHVMFVTQFPAGKLQWEEFTAEPDRTRTISFSRLLVHVQSSSTELRATGLFPPHPPSHSSLAVEIREVCDNLCCQGKCLQEVG